MRSTMRRPQRLIAAAVLIAFSGVLAGCSSGFGSGFDPSDLLDWLDTKKKLPGERKPVFPEGVPGLEQGVPKDLYKGTQQQQDVPPVAAAPQPDSKQVARKGKGKQPAAAPADQAAAPVEVDGEATATEEPAAAAPAPKPKKIVRKRTTAPPPDPNAPPQAAAPAAQSAQQSPSPFPAPLPGGTFTR
jgi:hypothetical protein